MGNNNATKQCAAVTEAAEMKAAAAAIIATLKNIKTTCRKMCVRNN